MGKSKKQTGKTLSALQATLARGDIAPVYLITGIETFLADEAVRCIAEAIESQSPHLARSSYHGEEADLATVLDAVRTFNLFSPARLVTVSPADKFVQAHGEHLAAYAGSPAEGGHLILVVSSVDRRTKVTKVVEESGGLIACNRVYERDIVPWIRARTKAMDRQIDSPAASLLADFLGTDLSTIASELEKILTYIGTRKKITAADVEAVSVRDRGREIYDLTDAIGRKQPAQALTALAALVERDGSLSGILFMVAKHMRRLWAAKELIASGAKPVEAARQLGIQYFVERFLAQTGTFSLNGLRRACSALLRCESTLKSSDVGDLNKRVLLETTFIRLTGPRKTAANGS